MPETSEYMAVMLTIGGLLITTLLGVVAYFLNRLITQIDRMSDTVGQLDKNMALHVQLVTSLEKQLAEHVGSIDALKKQLAEYVGNIEALKKQLKQLRSMYEEVVRKYKVLEMGVKKFDDWLNNPNRE